MRKSAEFDLRRRGQCDRTDASLLRRYRVHHHAARVGDPPARHVQPHPLHREPAFGDPGPGGDVDRQRLAALRTMDEPAAADGLGQRIADAWVELVQRVGERVGRNPHRRRADPVEPLARIENRRITAVTHVITDGTDRVEGGLDIERRAGQQPAQRWSRRQTRAQIELSQHDDESIRTRTRCAVVGRCRPVSPPRALQGRSTAGARARADLRGWESDSGRET